jgi:hypothetical protein
MNDYMDDFTFSDRKQNNVTHHSRLSAARRQTVELPPILTKAKPNLFYII